MSDESLTAHSRTSLDDLLSLARTNDPDALFELGNRHAYGTCHETDIQDELGLLWKGAVETHHAEVTLVGSTNDLTNRKELMKMRHAINLWCRAANLGSSEAMYRLGLTYLEGEGVKKSHAQAFKWLLLATTCDHPKASETVQRLKYIMPPKDREEGFRLMQEWLENPDLRTNTN